MDDRSQLYYEAGYLVLHQLTWAIERRRVEASPDIDIELQSTDNRSTVSLPSDTDWYDDQNTPRYAEDNTRGICNEVEDAEGERRV